MLKSRFTFLLPVLAAAFLAFATPAFAQEEAVTGASTESSATAEKHGEENLGFPQLKAETYPTQLFWLLVSFVLLYVLMSQLALPRVGAVLDVRKEKREGDLSRAQSLQEEAEKIKIAYDKTLAEAQGRASETMSAAEQEISEKNSVENARFSDHARKRIVTAEQTINRAKNDAMQSLADISAEIAAEMVNKIAGTQLTKAEAKKAVTAAMQEGS